jgi:hypothetical protein
VPTSSTASYFRKLREGVIALSPSYKSSKAELCMKAKTPITIKQCIWAKHRGLTEWHIRA